MRVLALDIDGTLVDGDGEFFPGTVEAVQRAREMGVEPALVTGRGWPATRPIARALAVRLPCVLYLGVQMVDPGSEATLSLHPLDRADVLRLVAAAGADGLGLGIYSLAGRGWTRHPDDYTPAGVGARIGAPVLDDVRPLLAAPVLQIFVAGPRSTRAVLALLPELPGVQAICYDAGTPQERAQLIRSGITKGAGLAALCARLGIDRSQVLAMGDNLADLSMLQWAGRSAAMPGAEAALQAAATLALPLGEERPVEAALRQLLPRF